MNVSHVAYHDAVCTILLSAFTGTSAASATYSHGHMGMLTASYGLLRSLATLSDRNALVPGCNSQDRSRLQVVFFSHILYPPACQGSWYRETSLFVQNLEGAFYQTSTGARAMPGGGAKQVEHVRRFAQLRPHAPMWLVSGSFYPLTKVYAKHVLDSWGQADHVGIRESSSAHMVREYAPLLKFHTTLDIALTAPNAFGSSFLGHMARRHKSLSSAQFTAILMTSSRHDGFGELVPKLVRALPTLSTNRSVRVRMGVPIRDDVQRARDAAADLPNVVVDVNEGPTPADYLYELTRANVVISARYHGVVMASMVSTATVALPAKTGRVAAFVADAQHPCVHYADTQRYCHFQSNPAPQRHTEDEVRCAADLVMRTASYAMRICSTASDAAKSSAVMQMRSKAFKNFPLPSALTHSSPFDGATEKVDFLELGLQEAYVKSVKDILACSTERENDGCCIDLSNFKAISCKAKACSD